MKRGSIKNFCAAVLRNAGNPNVGDLRGREALKIVRLGTSVVIEFYKDEPATLAATMSGDVQVVNAPAVDKMSKATDKGLQDIVSSCQVLPLATESIEIGQFLGELLTTEPGRSLYRDIAVLLLWGTTQEDLAPYMGVLQGAPPVRPTEVQPDECIVALARTSGPSAALQLLRVGEGEQLSLARQGATLDRVLEEIPDRRQALALFKEQIAPARRTELLAARGDLASSAAFVADPIDIAAAIFHDGVEHILLWLHKVQGHAEYEQLLELKPCRFTMWQIAVLHLYHEVAKEFKVFEDILLDTAEQAAEFGINPDMAIQFLHEEYQRELLALATLRKKDIDLARVKVRMTRITTANINAARANLERWQGLGRADETVRQVEKAADELAI